MVQNDALRKGWTMKTKHGTIILLLITTLLGLGGKVNADEAAGAANRIPVAIVSAVVGEEDD